MSEIDFKAQIQENWEAGQPALSSRTIVLKGPIMEENANCLIAHLLLLEQISREPIVLVLHSDGGRVYPGLAIYDVLRHLKAPLITVADTMSAGSALLLLMAGHKRYALPGSRMAYTPLATTHTGTDYYILSTEILRLQGMQESIYQQHVASLKHPNPLLQLFGVKRPTWDLKTVHTFSLDEAMDYQLIHEVVNRVEDIARS